MSQVEEQEVLVVEGMVKLKPPELNFRWAENRPSRKTTVKSVIFC